MMNELFCNTSARLLVELDTSSHRVLLIDELLMMVTASPAVGSSASRQPELTEMGLLIARTWTVMAWLTNSASSSGGKDFRMMTSVAVEP